MLEFPVEQKFCFETVPIQQRYSDGSIFLFIPLCN